MKLETMSLDDLFAALRITAIAEHESDDGEQQHAATREKGSLVREIAKRDGKEAYYQRLLVDEHPRVRYRGALGVMNVDSAAAMRVLRELSRSRLKAGLSVVALQSLIMLEKRGADSS